MSFFLFLYQLTVANIQFLSLSILCSLCSKQSQLLYRWEVEHSECRVCDCSARSCYRQLLVLKGNPKIQIQ
jgi:hypothetical protein